MKQNLNYLLDLLTFGLKATLLLIAGIIILPLIWIAGWIYIIADIIAEEIGELIEGESK